MTHFKKTIQFFVLGMFFTQHAVVLPMQGHFSPAPIFSHVDSQSFSAVGSSTFQHIFSDISNNVTNNPHMYVVIAAGCIVAIVCTSVYKSGVFANKFNLDGAAITSPIQQEIQSSLNALPWAIKGPIKVIVVPLKTLIHMLRAGAVNYIAYNKKHLGLSAVSMVGGYVAGHPVIGGAIGGMVFLHGAFNNRFDITDGKIDAVSGQMAANQAATLQKFAAASDEAVEHKKAIIEQVDKKANELSDALSGVDLRITTVGEQVNKNIDGVAQQVVTVHGDVQKIAEQIDALKEQLEKKIELETSKGSERDQKADEALAKLQDLSNQVNDFQTRIEKVTFQAAEQQQALAKHLECQMNNLSEQLVQQGNVSQEVKDAQLAQGSILTAIEQKVEEMLKLESEHASLLELFNNGQKNNTETLNALRVGQAQIEKAAVEFSAFYTEFAEVKTQVQKLTKSFAAKEEKDTKIFESMARKQVEVDGCLSILDSGMDDLKTACHNLLLQNQQQALQNQQQIGCVLAAINRLENRQDQSTDKQSLKDSPETTSVRFIPDPQFKQLPRFNVFAPGMPMSRSISSSNTRPLQLTGADKKTE